MAHASTSSSEQDALRQRAWAILVPVHALLLRRLADNTLLPGNNTEDEVTYLARSQAFFRKATDKAVPSAALLQGLGAVLGYETLLKAMFHTLNLLMALRDPALPQESADSFVLTALDAIPRTNTMNAKLSSEVNLVAMMETNMMPQNYEPTFCAAVLRKWRSSAVADVLRARGSLQAGVVAYQESVAQYEARQRADIEKIGLRECAWPSCDKVERTVREFKQCSGCRSVWYCSPEHHTLDWGSHRKDCQKLDKARRAAMAAGGEALGGEGTGSDGFRARSVSQSYKWAICEPHKARSPLGELRRRRRRGGSRRGRAAPDDARRLRRSRGRAEQHTAAAPSQRRLRDGCCSDAMATRWSALRETNAAARPLTRAR